MARRRKRRTRKSAQTANAQPKSEVAPHDRLRRRVAIECCRVALDVRTVLEMARALQPTKYWKDDDGVPHWVRMWHYCAKGDFGLSESRLKIMEKVVSDIRDIYNHVFFRLIGGHTFTQQELLDIIRKLPPPVADQLLVANTRENGSPIPNFQTFNFDGLRFLGNLDGVSGLLAFGLLCENTYRPETAREAMCAAVRLLGRCYASTELGIFMGDVWEILKPALLDRLAPGEFETRGMADAWMWMSYDFDRIREVCTKCGVLAANSNAYEDIVRLADCAHLDLIAEAASEAWQDWLIGNRRVVPEPIMLLEGAYREYIELKGHHSGPEPFYPHELLSRLDRSLAQTRPDWEADRSRREAEAQPLLDAFFESLHRKWELGRTGNA